MPTANPRITITLTPAVHALLKRMSTLTGNSQSAIVAELLETSQPVLQRVVTVLEAAHLAQANVGEKVKDSLAVAQAKLERQLGLALETMDEGARPLIDHAEAVKRRRAGAGGTRRAGGAAPVSAPRRTPMSNRGVTPSTSHPSKKTKGRS